MMNQKVEVDLTDMEKKLKCYVDKGSIAGSAEVRKEPMISVKADASLIKPLKKITTYTGSFVAVDCSTARALSDAGLLETLRREERSCSFADEIHGVKHAFEWEWWDDQF
jgi:hypothetical protein